MNVPFADLRIQYEALKTDIDSAIAAVIADTAFIRGAYVKIFENAFAKRLGVRHCVSCASGTDALFIALKMLDIGPGDDVITTASSWIATAGAVSATGAQPVFVDIEADYYTIDPTLVEAVITPRTRAIIPVHLYGQAADIPALELLCADHNLHLIEDAAQAHFSRLNGRTLGTCGIAAGFSFYPGKNLGCYGDGGCVVTDNDELAAKFRKFSDHGAATKHHHEMIGINSRLDGLQAAILSVKLEHIESWNAARRERAHRYNERLDGIADIVIPKIRPGAEHIYHIYAIRCSGRDALAAALKARGIQTGMHYPTPLPLTQAYAAPGHTPEAFPVAAAFQSEQLSLPMFPELTDDQIDHVAASIKSFYG